MVGADFSRGYYIRQDLGVDALCGYIESSVHRKLVEEPRNAGPNDEILDDTEWRELGID